MAVTAIYLLPCGYLNLDRSVFLTGVDMGQVARIPVFSVLLMHPEGPVLIDTGLNPDGLVDPERAWGPRARVVKPELTANDDVRHRLQELGLQVADIRMVILTHLHWDHTGALRFFDHCPIVVQRDEYRFALNPGPFFALQNMRNHIDFPLHYVCRDGDQQLLPGISVIRTPGHTPGHQSVLVKTAGGAFTLFTGDAINMGENLERNIPSANNWSNALALESMYRLQHLSQLLDAELIHSHDPVQWPTLTRSPQPYRSS